MTANANLAHELYLRNGVVVSVRPVTPDDEAAIFEFLTGLCEGSRRLRFFTAAADVRGEARRGAAGDDAEHHGLVAMAPGRGVVGHTIYVRLPTGPRLFCGRDHYRPRLDRPRVPYLEPRAGFSGCRCGVRAA